jgi:hypothetical protein
MAQERRIVLKPHDQSFLTAGDQGNFTVLK